jgi:hypothetical protein
MVKKTYLFFIFLLVMAAFSSAEVFEETDILGQWYVYEIDVSPTMGAYWLYADLNVVSTTDITGTLNAPDGSSMVIESGEASIAADGSLTGSFTVDTGVTGTVVNGLQDQNHSIFGFVGTDSEEALSFAVGVKGEGQYQTADMAGDWRFYAIQIDPNLPGLYWVYGDGAVGADGSISSGTYKGPDGTEISVTGGQFALTAEGKVSATFEFGDGSSSQVADGMVDSLKTLALFVDMDSTGRLGYDIALKKGGSYQPSDLAGDWKIYNFTIDVANELAYWVHGTGSIGSDGNLTGIYIAPDGSQFTISNGQASLSTSGELSGSFTVDGVANETIQSGFMDQNKSIIVFVGTSDNDQMDLGIGFRTSEIPITPSSGGGGGGGGCFLNSIWD